MSNNKYDLIERTSLFGEQIILFVKKISDTTTSKPIKNQLVQSGTSIGANYMEADGAESGRDFNHKLSICKKEAKEKQEKPEEKPEEKTKEKPEGEKEKR